MISLWCWQLRELSQMLFPCFTPLRFLRFLRFPDAATADGWSEPPCLGGCRSFAQCSPAKQRNIRKKKKKTENTWGGIPSMGVPQNRWFVIWTYMNPYWNGWFGGTPISGNLHIVYSHGSLPVGISSVYHGYIFIVGWILGWFIPRIVSILVRPDVCELTLLIPFITRISRVISS